MNGLPTPVLGGGAPDSRAWEIIRNSRARVRLVAMPLSAECRPALGLGLLRSALRQIGVGASVVYANILYAESFRDLYRLLEPCHYLRVTDWIFAPTVFPEYDPPSDRFLAEVIRHLARLYRIDLEKPEVIRAMTQVLRAARRMSQTFIDNLADALLAGRPQVIGCSSVFEQHVASLGLLKAARARDPSVVTIMGGANCQGRMGVATAREFPWVDYVFSGEAEDIFPAFCAAALRHGRAIPEALIPPGVFNRTRAGALAGTPDADLPRHVLANLDDAPEPDYEEYFDLLRGSAALRKYVSPALLLESSRGCWWRDRKRCTFCGLNGGRCDFRAKTPARFLRELEHLTERHRVNRVEMTDNILDMRYFPTVVPELIRRRKNYNLFYETKANLTRRQVRQLHAAGVSWIQPGLEALHNRLLTLMQKGTTVTQNVQTLKYACEVGMRASWALLAGFPGERDEWHLETAAWLPLIFHLQPPFYVLTMQFQRFSVYHDSMEEYGLKLKASEHYRMAYPFPEKTMRELAYYFELEGQSDSQRAATPGIRALRRQLVAWNRARAADIPAVLCLEEKPGGNLAIFDTRPCAVECRTLLEGPLAAIYRSCEPAVSADRLPERMRKMNLPECDADTARRAAQELIRRRLLLSMDGRLLTLAVPGDIPSLPGKRHFPGGFSYGANVKKVLAAGGLDAFP